MAQKFKVGDTVKIVKGFKSGTDDSELIRQALVACEIIKEVAK